MEASITLKSLAKKFDNEVILADLSIGVENNSNHVIIGQNGSGKSTTAKIALGLQDKIILGNIDSKRDWGYAPEFVEAMWLMLQNNKPQDFVIATGETHTVREFIELSFNYFNIDLRRKKEVPSPKSIKSNSNSDDFLAISINPTPAPFEPSSVSDLSFCL